MDERAVALAELPIEDRVFASIVRDYFARVPYTHRFMAEAGMMLLALASEGEGPHDEDDDDAHERHIEHTYRAAYALGLQQGRKATIAEIDRRLKALDRTA